MVDVGRVAAGVEEARVLSVSVWPEMELIQVDWGRAEWEWVVSSSQRGWGWLGEYRGRLWRGECGEGGGDGGSGEGFCNLEEVRRLKSKGFSSAARSKVSYKVPVITAGYQQVARLSVRPGSGMVSVWGWA